MASVKHLIVLSFLMPFTVLADNYKPFPHKSPPWSLIASLGYGNYKYMFQQDGSTALGRLGFAIKIADIRFFFLGLEAGVQSGNRMRFDIPEEILNEMGGLPLETTVKPFLDLLITAQSIPLPTLPLSIIAKGGFAYRQMQFYRESVNNLNQINMEIQFGFLYQISKHANINLLYQHIYGGNPNFSFNTLTQKGHIAKIPREQAILLGFSISL
ncbi:MAG: hypothetical protein H0T84_03385 [Tatlockia sp.]|nr:hypothetical protein [Tatlockia sp.]